MLIKLKMNDGKKSLPSPKPKVSDIEEKAHTFFIGSNNVLQNQIKLR